MAAGSPAMKGFAMRRSLKLLAILGLMGIGYGTGWLVGSSRVPDCFNAAIRTGSAEGGYAFREVPLGNEERFAIQFHVNSHRGGRVRSVIISGERWHVFASKGLADHGLLVVLKPEGVDSFREILVTNWFGDAENSQLPEDAGGIEQQGEAGN